jgi:hypothetical protein
VFTQTPIATDSSDTIVSNNRTYITWTDEVLNTNFGTSIGSLNGYQWFTNVQGDNPLGFAFRTIHNAGITSWSLLDGSLHPRAYNQSAFLGMTHLSDTKQKHQLLFDLTFGNERGDPGVWNATDRLTPNSDRKGPDMTINYVFRPNDKSSFTVSGYFFETAIDDIPQIKRLKTVLDGDNLTGLRMPILQSYGLRSSYKYYSKNFNLTTFGSVSNSDNYQMNRFLGFEEPQNLNQYLLGFSSLWKVGTKAPSIRLEASVQNEEVNALRNEINYVSGQDWSSQLAKLELEQPLFKGVKFGLFGEYENFNHQRLEDDFSSIGALIRIESKRQEIVFNYGYNGNSDDLLANHSLKFNYSVFNLNKDFIVSICAEQKVLTQYKMDALLSIQINGNQLDYNSTLNTPWIEGYRAPSIQVFDVGKWYKNQKVNLSIESLRIGKLSFWYNTWDYQIGLFTNYQYNEHYLYEDRSLPVRNETAVIKQLPDFTQYGASLITNNYQILPSKKLSVQIGAHWFNEINSLEQNEAMQLQRVPIPELQAFTKITTNFRPDFDIQIDLRYRSAINLAYLNGLNNMPHGIHKNNSIVDLGTFSSKSNAALFANIHITKIVGIRRPIALFVDLNNISKNGVVYHPFGAVDIMTLMTGIRLKIL